MWGICRLFLFVSVCMVLLLAGCVPIQPEPTATATPEPTATATPEPTAAPLVSTDWQVNVDTAHGLSISYPPGWIFVDPMLKELTDLFEEAGEQAGNAEMKELVDSLLSAMQETDLFAGLGIRYVTDGSSAPAYLSNFSAFVIPFEDLTLELMTQMTAAQLDRVTGIAVDSAEVAAGLWPNGAEVLSIRYRADGALYGQPGLEIVGWQVGVLSPDAGTMLILTYSVPSEDFAELEPLLVEIMHRVQWLE